MNNDNELFDMDGRKIEVGHIVAVRYVWNSYVGEITMRGLSATGSLRHAFFSPHKLKHKNTYQILSHKKESHPDFNKEVNEWYKSEDENLQCPIKIRIYETKDWLDAVENAKKSIAETIEKNKKKYEQHLGLY